jgi:hypothetical protein
MAPGGFRGLGGASRERRGGLEVSERRRMGAGRGPDSRESREERRAEVAEPLLATTMGGSSDESLKHRKQHLCQYHIATKQNET